MKAKDGASFVRPTECTNCETLFGDPFDAEICIDIETQDPIGSLLFDYIQLETENVCPYELSLELKPISKQKINLCTKFLAHKVPHFKILPFATSREVSRNISQNKNTIVEY